MSTITCSQCGKQNKPDSKFCSQCGKQLTQPARPTHCPNPGCDRPLGDTDVFCPACGTKIEVQATVIGPSAKVGAVLPTTYNVKCKDCKHFRPAIAISSLIQPGANKYRAEALTKIREDETKRRDSEATLKLELLKTNCAFWGSRPLMSDFCAAKMASNIYEIFELKNGRGDCPDFQPRQPERARDCFTCVYRIAHEDPYSGFKACVQTLTQKR